MRIFGARRVLPLLLVIGLSIPGCDSLLEPEPAGQVVVDNIFNNMRGASTAVTAAYAPLADAYDYALPLLADRTTDDGWGTRDANITELNIEETNDFVSSLWRDSYQGVARCNTVLSRLPGLEVSSDQEERKSSLMGEAFFLRGFYYFNLVRLFGGVPLFTEEVTNPRASLIARAPPAEVYAQIEQDLNEAAQRLPLKSQLAQKGIEAGRATKGAAQALLAQVYLTQEKWSEAAAAAQEVIDSDEYTLHENYAANFQGRNENGIESVFEVQYSNSGGGVGAIHNTVYGPAELVPGGLFGSMILTDDSRDFGYPGDQMNRYGLVQAFEEGDERFETTVTNFDLPNPFDSDSGEPGYYLTNKYFTGMQYSQGDSPVNYPVLRYSEVLLNAAEALNEMGRNAQAVDYVNQVRKRADLSPLDAAVAADQGALREAIWHELRVETYFEGQRLFDLNRTGQFAERVNNGDQVSISPDDPRIATNPITDQPKFLFPIPLSELDRNPNVEQNPGY